MYAANIRSQIVATVTRNVRPEHAVVWNSWVLKSEFAKQSDYDEDVVDAIYGDQDKKWFCGDCKYPKCQMQTSSQCLRRRDTKSKLRFSKWTCTHCQHMAEMCPACEKPCLLDEKFHDNLKNLHASIDTLGRLPRRREGGH